MRQAYSEELVEPGGLFARNVIWVQTCGTGDKTTMIESGYVGQFQSLDVMCSIGKVPATPPSSDFFSN